MNCLYTPFDLAVYFKTENFRITEKHEIIESLWERREELLSAEYHKEKKQFVNSLNHELYKMDGLLDCVDEINLILKEMGSKYRVSESEFEQDVIESFFKVIKLRLTFTPGKAGCRIKLRTLIDRFGYKRRTAALVDRINRTVNSLGLETFLFARYECDIGDVSLDRFIIFRLK